MNSSRLSVAMKLKSSHNLILFGRVSAHSRSRENTKASVEGAGTSTEEAHTVNSSNDILTSGWEIAKIGRKERGM